MPELLLDVLLERLLDLLRADAVGVDRVGDVAHHRLDLHPVRLLQQLDHLLALVGVVGGHDVAAGRCLVHRLSLSVVCRRVSRLPGRRNGAAQRERELEARRGIVESASEPLPQPAEPVAHGLRVDVELGRDPRDLPLVVEPGAQRLGEPRARRRRLAVERREPHARRARPARARRRARPGRRGGRRRGRTPARRRRPAPIRRRSSRARSALRRAASSSTVGPSTAAVCAGGALERRAQARRLGIGEQREAALGAAGLRHQRVRRQPGTEPAAGRRSRRAPRRVAGSSQSASAAAARTAASSGSGSSSSAASRRRRRSRLARGRRLRLGVAVGRERRELVDVGEHRLGEQGQRPPVDPGLDRDRRDPPPGDPGAEPVGGEQGVERAALAVLAPAERPVDGVAGAAVEVGIADQVDELAQRLLDPAADPGAEAPAQRAPVGGHALADRLDDLVAERGDVRADQLADPRRKPAPGLVDVNFLCADDKILRLERGARRRNYVDRRLSCAA